MNTSDAEPIPGSFRDPNGFLYKQYGKLLRQVNQAYQNNYQLLMNSGLYEKLVSQGKLVAHEEVSESGLSEDAFVVLQPELIEFISYPYEWSFSQLKDAALLTLDIQLMSLKHGMCLKDASAYNVQFKNGKPVFIDTLSFEKYEEGAPWVAYKQFCQHFLAPLALMAKTDIRLNKLLANFIDGIPLDLASSMLPVKTRFTLGLGLHIHMHAKQQAKSADSALDKESAKQSMGKTALIALMDGLKSCVNKLTWKPGGTEWHDYYQANNNYNEGSLGKKEQLVSDFVESAQASSVWDLGANDGRFSRIARRHAKHVVSWDIDPACVENNYLFVNQQQETGILPLLMDLTNPSPSIGWANEERDGFMFRGGCDLVMALGLIHHLAISNNLPLNHIAKTFSQLAGQVIVEFVPKEDSQVVKLLSSREDIFPDYQLDKFEEIFSQYFSIVKKEAIEGSCRTLYLFQTK